MGEHFNVAIVLRPAVCADKRQDILAPLEQIYSSFFANIHEVCLHNYESGTSVCKDGPEGEILAGANIGSGELLFIYGGRGKHSTNFGTRSSIHIQNSEIGTAFSISLPLVRDIGRSQLELYVLETKRAIERLSDTFIVVAGWELECDPALEIADLLSECFAKDTLCQWIAVPKPLLPTWPQAYVKVEESDQTLLLKNTAIT